MNRIPLTANRTTDQTFAEWRFKARTALVRGIPPEEMDFIDPYDHSTLRIDFSPETAAQPHDRKPVRNPHVPATFLYAALHVAHHEDPARWNLLYRLLWRLQIESDLMHDDANPDVAALRRMQTELRDITVSADVLKKPIRSAEVFVLRPLEVKPHARSTLARTGS